MTRDTMGRPPSPAHGRGVGGEGIYSYALITTIIRSASLS